jgi:hypothetical protein
MITHKRRAVQEFADREEIRNSPVKYAHWVTLGEGAKVTQLFTDSAAFINGKKPNINARGRKQLDECYPKK